MAKGAAGFQGGQGERMCLLASGPDGGQEEGQRLLSRTSPLARSVAGAQPLRAGEGKPGGAGLGAGPYLATCPGVRPKSFLKAAMKAETEP